MKKERERVGWCLCVHILDVCAQPPAPSALCAFDEAGSEQWQRLQQREANKREASSFIHDSVHIYIYIYVYICMLCMHSHGWLFCLLLCLCCCLAVVVAIAVGGISLSVCLFP